MSIDRSGTEYQDSYVENSVVFPSTTHTTVISSRYYRLTIRGICCSFTGGVQTVLHTAKSRQITTSVGQQINETNDCELTRAVITGRMPSGVYRNVQANEDGSMAVTIANPTSAYGELSSVTSVPVYQVLFVYDVGEYDVISQFEPPFILDVTTRGDVGVAQVQSLTFSGGAAFPSSGAGSYFLLYSTGDVTTYYVWIDVDNGNTDPTPGGTGVEIDIGAADSSSTVASAVSSAIGALGDFSSAVTTENIISVTNATTGTATSVQAGTMPTTSLSTVSTLNSLMSLTSSAGVGSYATLLSRRSILYRAGQAGLARFTLMFDSPTVGTQQIGGVGNQISGFLFGYNASAEFCIIHRKSGQPEIRQLVVTAYSIDSIVVTVDDVDYQITLVGATTATDVAYQIGQYNFAPGNWSVEVTGTTVTFLSVTAT